MYGEEAEKFEMPTVASLTSRLGHEFGGSPRGGLGASGMGSKTNLVGSKNNLLGSVNVLAGGGGSAINLLGSYAELLQGGGSSMGLNSRGSFMNLGSRANLHG